MKNPEREQRDNQPISTMVEERPIGIRHIQILLDRSGSMESIKGSMEEGYGSFLAEQRAIPGAEAIKYTLTTFDSPSGIEDVDVGSLLTAKALTLMPRGGTPLYKSLVATIERAAKRMDKDDVMLFVVITDGQDTDGGVTLDEARALIAKKMDEGWAFIYLGANQDAWAIGRAMGYKAGTTMDFAANAAGSAGMYSATSSTATRYRVSATRAQIKNLQIDPDEDKKKE
jgi:hypothetical protein